MHLCSVSCTLPHPDSSCGRAIHYGGLIWKYCHTQLGQGDVIMSSCLEIAGQLIVYLLHNHIAVRGASPILRLGKRVSYSPMETSMLTRINLDFWLLTMATTTTIESNITIELTFRLYRVRLVAWFYTVLITFKETKSQREHRNCQFEDFFFF